MIKSPISIVHTIQKQLLGKKLTYKEIFDLMDKIGHEKISDILITYFVASSFKKGFTNDELYLFTKAMVETGNRLHFKGIVADKHSIGGVAGTRATMIIVPIIASAGYLIPKISSRAITTPAGTADTMEVFACVDFKPPAIEEIVNSVGGCICWNGNLGIAPADDVIIRVEEPISFESFDKIIVSVMAKKVAAAATHLIIDIPLGKTMKIHKEEDAHKVMSKFKLLGSKFGVKIQGEITQTKEPAGIGIGPMLEAKDVLSVLEQNDDRPKELEQRAIKLASSLLRMCYVDDKIHSDPIKDAVSILQSGKALHKFREIIRAQGGNDNVSYNSLHIHAKKRVIKSVQDGLIRELNNHNINSIAKLLGAPKNKHAGILLHKKTGAFVSKNEPLLTLHAQTNYILDEAVKTLQTFPIHTFT